MLEEMRIYTSPRELNSSSALMTSSARRLNITIESPFEGVLNLLFLSVGFSN